MEEKIMHYANFNITFGESEEPMLTHFENIIFPAFTEGYTRGKEGDNIIFSLQDVKIKKLENDEYILVGNYVKDTQYTVHTTVKDGHLVQSPAQIPTAPYSRFIIFLKNHRMILVRNETLSPEIRSFQATIRSVLNEYISKKNRVNKIDKLSPLPFAFVNIVDIPLKEDIASVLKGVAKINWVQLRFFPLNNDFNPLPVANSIRTEMKVVGSRTANLKYNSPDSKQGVQTMLEATSGLATTTMSVSNENGETKKIKEQSFSSNKKISFNQDITADHDEYFTTIAKKDDIINITSPENKKLYEKFIKAFVKLMF